MLCRRAYLRARLGQLVVAGLCAVAVSGAPVAAQHQMGDPLAGKVTRQEAVVRIWSDFVEFCSLAVADPNIIIQRAAAHNAAGGEANLTHTEDETHISVSMGDGRFDILVTMARTPEQAMVNCQSLGVWMNATGNMTDAAGMNLAPPEDTLPLFQAQIAAHDPGIEMTGGKEIVAFGRSAFDLAHVPGQAGSAAELMIRQNVYLLSPVFDQPDIITTLYIGGGQATVDVVRTFPSQAGGN
jgi:hypothetical protein